MRKELRTARVLLERVTTTTSYILSFTLFAVKFDLFGNLQSEAEVVKVKDALEQGRQHAAALHTSLAKVISFCKKSFGNLVQYKFYFCIS